MITYGCKIQVRFKVFKIHKQKGIRFFSQEINFIISCGFRSVVPHKFMITIHEIIDFLQFILVVDFYTTYGSQWEARLNDNYLLMINQQAEKFWLQVLKKVDFFFLVNKWIVLDKGFQF